MATVASASRGRDARSAAVSTGSESTGSGTYVSTGSGAVGTYVSTGSGAVSSGAVSSGAVSAGAVNAASRSSPGVRDAKASVAHRRNLGTIRWQCQIGTLHSRKPKTGSAERDLLDFFPISAQWLPTQWESFKRFYAVYSHARPICASAFE